jgi:hypothetical protein
MLLGEFKRQDARQHLTFEAKEVPPQTSIIAEIGKTSQLENKKT